jgi:rhamnosyltransferase
MKDEKHKRVPQTPSVIVRTHNSGTTLNGVLEGLRAQSVRPEVVVVDSGSSDGTLAMARRFADELVQLRPGTFSHGRALNRGIERSSGDVIFALSSHSLPPSRRWIEDALAHHLEERVIATCGARVDSRGRELTTVVRQDIDMARETPFWGLTNTAASWRADLVRANPFDEDLEACEDKEWALRLLRLGGVVVIDPALAVDAGHRTGQGMGAYMRRMRRERRALIRIGALQRESTAAVARQWYRERRHPPVGQRGFTSVTAHIDALATILAQRDVR